MKKFLIVLLNLFLLNSLVLAEACVDNDKDSYIYDAENCPEDSYPACIDTFNDIKNIKDDSVTLCPGMKFKKGFESEACDSPEINEDSGLFDVSKVNGPLKGRTINPGQSDVPNNGVDEDCNGVDGDGGGAGLDFKDMVNKIVKFLSTLSLGVSVIVLIGGGIMYSTAAGNDEKTSKARKAMIGALIGALISFFAPHVVQFVITQFS